jgi:hypothetical protein
MEGAFFKSYWENREFKLAFVEAVNAGAEYDVREREENMSPQDQVRLEGVAEAAEVLEAEGFQAAVSSYSEKFAAPLGQEHKILLGLVDDLMGLVSMAHEGYDGDQVKTTLEVGNRLVAMATTSDQPSLFLILFGALMTELAGCPEAREMLQARRQTVPGVVL